MLTVMFLSVRSPAGSSLPSTTVRPKVNCSEDKVTNSLLPLYLTTYLHFGLDLSAGEVATVSTGLTRVGAHDLGDGL